MSFQSKTRLLVSSILCAAASTAAAFAQAEPDLLFNARLRYEQVDQTGIANEASALTLRTRLGVDSGDIEGFRFLIEAENVVHLVDDFNSTVNGHVGYPVVADPEATEINRAQVSFSGFQNTVLTLGRQRVILGDARYVGNVGFRQNEQTFDAFRLAWSGIDDVQLDYVYLDRAHRIFGDDHPAGEWDLDAHLLDVTVNLPVGSLRGFAYLVDNQDVAALSTSTLGVRWNGSAAQEGGPDFSWFVEYAHQSDYANNAGNFDLDMLRAQVGVSVHGVSGSIGFESLDGDGVRGFLTPLATLHAYQGWADAFLTTPASGIQDLYVRVGWTASQPPFGEGLSAAVVYHDFDARSGGGDLGSELDAVITSRLTAHYALELKAAFYDGPTGGPADRDKVWLSLMVNY